MLAPSELVATSPSTPSAAAVSRVVVVLPLVPEISAICRPAARLASRFGSIIRPILPPMTDPSPRPVARDSAAALRETDEASFDRSGFLVLTRARLAEPSRRFGNEVGPDRRLQVAVLGRGAAAGGQIGADLGQRRPGTSSGVTHGVSARNSGLRARVDRHRRRVAGLRGGGADIVLRRFGARPAW